MSVKTNGLDELIDQLERAKKGVEEIEPTVSFDDLFPISFMEKYTNFSSIYSLLEAGGFTVGTQEDFEAIPENELDIYVADNTKFANWQDMLDKAGEEYLNKKLGF